MKVHHWNQYGLKPYIVELKSTTMNIKENFRAWLALTCLLCVLFLFFVVLPGLKGNQNITKRYLMAHRAIAHISVFVRKFNHLKVPCGTNKGTFVAIA